MRITKDFGKTTPHFKTIQGEKIKYILAFEGSKTEVQYFEGINKNKEEIGINPIIKLIYAKRDALHESYSHPKNVVELLEKCLKENIIVEDVINIVLDFFSYNKEDNFMNDLKNNLTLFFYENFLLNINNFIDVTNDLISKLISHLEQNNYTIDAEKLNQYIKDKLIQYVDYSTYSKDLDHICIIIDRNKRNLRLPTDYNTFLEECKNKKYRLFVTNPDFEFFLLLHFDKVFNFNTQRLLLNPKRDLNNKKSKKKRYLQHILSDIFDGYKKGKIDFDKFKPYIKKAIQNEKQFCEDIVRLENELGSNIGLLLQEIL